MQYKKAWMLALMLALLSPWAAGASAATYQDGVYRDLAEGHNDTVVVTLTVRGGRIEGLEAENRSGVEPTEYMRQAVEGMRERIIDKQGTQGVDAVSGATGSSQSILEAAAGTLAQAGEVSESGADAARESMEGTTGGPGGTGGTAADGTGSDATGQTGGASSPVTPRPTVDPASAKLFAGLGGVANFRVGPGKDDAGNQVYSFNVAMASALFDPEGRIVHVRSDIYEVSTPNYDGESMPNFTGWPGQGGQTEQSAEQELAGWVTKRERGDRYGMNPQNEWYKQMNAYEQWMLGKTVAELREWLGNYANAKTGRPIKLTSEDADDKRALEGMSDAEKQALADVTGMATMSLSDAHGRILEAIEKAYENRVPVDYGQ